MLSLGNAEGEMQNALKALLKPCFHTNIKFVVLPQSSSILGRIYFNSIKVNYYLMRKYIAIFTFSLGKPIGVLNKKPSKPA